MELLLLLLLPLLALPTNGSDNPSDDEGEATAQDEATLASNASFAARQAASGATDGNDLLNLPSGADSVDGLAGNDTIDGNTGDDSLAGGPGNDSLLGDWGNDQLSGGLGNDAIYGGRGNDSYGSASGEAGSDLVYGGTQDDRLGDGLGADTLHGDDGRDTLFGAALDGFDLFADRLYGGNGSDLLTGDSGDSLSGGAKDDTFVIYPGGDPVVITDFQTEEMNPDPASDGDLLLILAPDGTLIDLQDHVWDRTAANGVDHEVLLGDKVVAVLKGPIDGDIWIEVQESTDQHSGWGGTGDNSVIGRNRADFLYGGDGDDQITGKAGDDFATDGQGDDRVDLGAGNDQYLGIEWADGASDNDDIHGGRGDDSLETTIGADTLHGDAGNDVIMALDASGQTGPVADFLSGGSGEDRLYGDAGDRMSGGSGADDFWVDGNGMVTVNDFQPGQDEVLLQVSRSAVITFAAANATDTLVLVDGTAMVTLRGILPAEIPPADVRAA
jgi:Ca2+-binding RTX toxin-like protein